MFCNYVIVKIIAYLPIPEILSCKLLNKKIKTLIESRWFIQLYNKQNGTIVSHLDFIIALTPPEISNTIKMYHSKHKHIRRLSCSAFKTGHHGVTWNDVLENPNIWWNWEALSQNLNITWEIIINNPDQKWNWSYVSLNPNLTWDIIINNMNKKWDWEHISINHFSQEVLF